MRQDPRPSLDDPSADHNRPNDEEVVSRDPEAHDTPRRYEQRPSADEDPVMPSEDPSLATKI